MRHLTRRMLSLVGLLAIVGFCLTATNSEAAPVGSRATAEQLVNPFDLVVSLEWTPGTGDKLATDLAASGCGTSAGEVQYVNDLIAGLRLTSAYLYDLSDGQMALRDIKIYTGAQEWANADIRVLATSSTRPAAFPGGIVDVPTRYNSGSGGASVFYPGSIYLGRLWDGTGSRCGRWSMQVGSRTIGHEWAHYALYLWDEYIDQGTSEEKYCTNVGPGVNGKGILSVDPRKSDPVYSAMAYHYRSDELWHPDVPDTGACKATPQFHVHGASDWDTVKRFYAVTTPARFGLDIPFEGSAAAAMFNPLVVTPSGTPVDTSAPTRTGPMARPRMIGLSYMIRPVLDANLRPLKNRRPLRIIGQGEIAAEGGFVLPFWGALASAYDRAAVVTQNWANNARRASYPKNYYTAPALSLTTTNNVTPAVSAWQPTVSISPTLTTRSTKTPNGTIERHSEVTGITVRVSDCFQSTPPPMEFFLCPAGGTCGSPVAPPLVNGARQYTFPFKFDGQIDPPASYGYVYVRVPRTGEETVSWYQLAGSVGPASIEGHAPLLDGLLNVDLPPDVKPPLGRDSMVMFSPAQTCLSVLPTGIQGILGPPLQVQVAVANRATPWGALTSDPRLRVRMSYNEELARRMGIEETSLVLLRYIPGSKNRAGTWRPEQLAGRSTSLDWLAIGSRAFSRQGETFAIGYR